MGRYTNIPIDNTDKGKRYYSTTKYPNIPLSFNDVYVYTDEGDRFDILAQTYYSDYPPLGIQIRIPSNISGIIAQYDNLNTQ